MGLLLCLGLSQRFLLREIGCERMGDRDTSRRELPFRDGLIDLLVHLCGQPYVRLSKAPLFAGLPKALDTLAAQRIWHFTPNRLVTLRDLPDSEVAVESGVKNPFTIDRFSGGKLLWLESFSTKGRVNSHVKTRFLAIPSYTRDSILRSIRSEVRLGIRHYDSATWSDQ